MQRQDFSRDALEQYSADLKELAMKIMYKTARALAMQAEDMDVLFEEGLQMMRIKITTLLVLNQSLSWAYVLTLILLV